MTPFVSIMNFDGVKVSYQIEENKDKSYTAKMLKCSGNNCSNIPQEVKVKKDANTKSEVAERLVQSIKKAYEEDEAAYV